MRNDDIIDVDVEPLPDVQVPALLESEETELDLRNLDASKVINLRALVQDYGSLRTTVLENVMISRKMIQSVAQELELSPEISPELLESFSSLTNTTNQSLKILTESYKNIASILISIHKINKEDTSHQNTSQHEEVVSTADILERLRQ